MSMDKWILNPLLEIEHRGDRLALGTPYVAHRLVTSAEVERVLEVFRTPCSCPEAEWLGVAPSVTYLLVSYEVLLPASSAHTLSRGILMEASSPIGGGAYLHSLRSQRGEGASIGVIGCPIDTTHGYAKSPKLGPMSIRSAWSKAGFELKGEPPRDVGDVVHHPHYEGAAEAGKRLAYAWLTLTKCNILPVVLGGDHSMSFYAVRAAMDHYQQLCVVQFDAHTDMALEGRNLTHANVFSRLLTDKRLRHLCQVGIRRPYPSREVGRSERVSRVVGFPSDRKFAANLPPDLPVYVSVDLDVLDAMSAPEVTTPEFGGLTVSSVAAALRGLKISGRLVGVDLMEVCGSMEAGEANRAAAAACELLSSVGRT